MPDLTLLEIVRGVLEEAGFKVSEAPFNEPNTLVASQGAALEFKFRANGRILSVEPWGQLHIFKVNGAYKQDAVLDMADPDSIENLNRIITAIKKANKKCSTGSGT